MKYYTGQVTETLTVNIYCDGVSLNREWNLFIFF